MHLSYDAGVEWANFLLSCTSEEDGRSFIVKLEIVPKSRVVNMTVYICVFTQEEDRE